MDIEKTEALLKRFDYKYQVKGQLIEVKLGLGLRVNVDFSEEGKIKIENRLSSFSFLSGIFGCSLKTGILINFIGSIVFMGIFIFTFEDYTTLLVIFLILIFWVLLWSSYYLIKAEHMKHTLIRWNEA